MKKFICLILSLLFILPSLCFTSCDSANVGDPDGVAGGDIVGGLSTDEEQNAAENKNPNYTAPAKYKEIAKSDKVYKAGIYTGYSIVIKDSVESEHGRVLGYNLNEIMLKYPGEELPVHEDPTCSHDSMRCPTMSEGMSTTALIIDRDDGLPIIFYCGVTVEAVYSEEGEPIRSQKVAEVRSYDVETGEYTTAAKLALGKVESAILYKGKMFLTGDNGYKLGMVDILTGESKIIENEGYFNEYNVLNIVNDRLYYMYSFGEEGTDDAEGKSDVALRSCSLDLDDVRVEYDFGDPDEDFAGLPMYGYSYINGGVLYLPKASHYAFDPREASPDVNMVYSKFDFIVYDIYALDLNDMSAGEKLVLSDVYKFAAKNGKLYYTLADYKEVGEVRFSGYYIGMFASTDDGALYEYDTASGTTREVYSDSGYNIIGIYEVTDDGKLFFDGRDYVNFVRAEDGNYVSDYQVGRKYYCMLDLSTGEITEIYAPLELEEPPEG